jgi:hypothetical protein
MSDDLDALVSQVEALHLEDDDVLVLMLPLALDDRTAAHIRTHVEARFPGRRVLVMDGGMQVQPLGQHRHLQRIEAALASVQSQLSTLLRALAEEDEPAATHTLDGDLFSTRERDPSQPL